MNKKHSLMLGLCGLAMAMVACQADVLSSVSENSASVVAEPKAHDMDTTGSSSSLIAWSADTTQDDTNHVGVVAIPAKPAEAYSSSYSEDYSSSSLDKSSSSSSLGKSSSSSSQGKSSSSVASSSSTSGAGSVVNCLVSSIGLCYSSTEPGNENLTTTYCASVEGTLVPSCDPYK